MEHAGLIAKASCTFVGQQLADMKSVTIAILSFVGSIVSFVAGFVAGGFATGRTLLLD